MTILQLQVILILTKHQVKQQQASGGGNITPNPDGDNSGSIGGSTTNPVNPGSDESGDESGSEIVDIVKAAVKL